MERDIFPIIISSLGLYFNSHAHVERDSTAIFVSKFFDISTHTLTWSVTFVAGIRLHTHFISTHTLTWSVTTHITVDFSKEWNFNSHAHVERDALLSTSLLSVSHFNSHAHVERDYQHLTLLSQFDISTHTLTWSVTRNWY